MQGVGGRGQKGQHSLVALVALQSSRGQTGYQGSGGLLCCDENKDGLWDSGMVPRSQCRRHRELKDDQEPGDEEGQTLRADRRWRQGLRTELREQSTGPEWRKMSWVQFPTLHKLSGDFSAHRRITKCRLSLAVQ